MAPVDSVQAEDVADGMAVVRVGQHQRDRRDAHQRHHPRHRRAGADQCSQPLRLALRFRGHSQGRRVRESETGEHAEQSYVIADPSPHAVFGGTEGPSGQRHRHDAEDHSDRTGSELDTHVGCNLAPFATPASPAAPPCKRARVSVVTLVTICVILSQPCVSS